VRVVILDNPQQVSLFAADRVDRLVRERLLVRQPLVLGLATGGTPLGLYKLLAERHRNDGLSFRGVETFNLDEYVGLPPDHEQSYHFYMHDALFRHVDFDTGANHLPRTWQCDLSESAKAYERDIEQRGGIDLQILGIGTDGHIGFNEVGSSLGSRTRLKTLTRRTRQDNARYFASIDEVPTMALTMGIATILESQSIVLMATGAGKARAVAGCVEGPISAGMPASALQLHPDVTVIVDTDAASELLHVEYYSDSERVRASLIR
jgi:glucosamine-6-phosphate deaminase